MAAMTAMRGGNLVIVNLQNTPMTNIALHIYAKIDDVMEMLMKKLEMPIPDFRLKRHAEFKLIKAFKNEILEASGIDPSGCPYQIFKSVNLNNQNGSKFTLEEAESKSDASYNVKLNF